MKTEYGYSQTYAQTIKGLVPQFPALYARWHEWRSHLENNSYRLSQKLIPGAILNYLYSQFSDLPTTAYPFENIFNDEKAVYPRSIADIREALNHLPAQLFEAQSDRTKFTITSNYRGPSYSIVFAANDAGMTSFIQLTDASRQALLKSFNNRRKTEFFSHYDNQFLRVNGLMLRITPTEMDQRELLKNECRGTKYQECPYLLHLTGGTSLEVGRNYHLTGRMVTYKGTYIKDGQLTAVIVDPGNQDTMEITDPRILH